MRNCLLLLFPLLSVFRLCAQEEENSYSLALPFPVSSGWTFVNSLKDSVVYPVYDSIVLREWEANGYAVVISKGNYGLLVFTKHLDTLIDFTCDTMFQREFAFFGRQKGLWYRWRPSELETLTQDRIGDVESWTDDGSDLYFHSNGRTGICVGYDGYIIPANYHYIRHFGSEIVREGRYLMEKSHHLVSDGKLFGLLHDYGTKELIPVVAEGIQRYEHGFYRYWQHYWKYVRISDGLIIDPQGGDVVIYDEQTWKIYDKSRTRGKLYRQSGAMVLSDAYEDYFVLENGLIAMRKDSLVGLMNPSGALQFSCRYEQVEAIGANRYRCMEAGKWYVCDARGTKLNATGFQHIEATGSGDQFLEVHLEQKKGLLSLNGAVVLPAEYDNIYRLQEFFVLEKEGKLAVANHKVQIFSEHLYDNYLIDDHLLVMRLDRKLCVLYAQTGPLNTKPCETYLRSGDVIKCYSPQMLEILILNEKGTAVSERQEYPGMQSFIVGKMPYRDWEYVKAGKIQSHLEEHQLSGYFGYRHNWSSGHVNPPSFREVQQNGAFGYHFGIEEYAASEFSVDEHLAFRARFRLQAVDPSAGIYLHTPFVSSTIQAVSAGGSSSANRINYFGNGRQDWWNTGLKMARSAAEIVYIDYSQPDLFYYNTGGTIVSAGTESGSFSAFDYYRSFNLGGNLEVSGPAISVMMDPASRLKVSGGKWYVAIDYTEDKTKIVDDLQDVYYDELSFGNDWDSDLDTYFGKPAEKPGYVWSFQHHDSIVLTHLLAVEMDKDHYCKVTAAEVETESGALSDSTVASEQRANFVLETPLKQGVYNKALTMIVPPVYAAVFCYNADFFLVKEDGKYGICSASGSWLVTLGAK